MRLFSYIVKNDTGFAPNPFFGILTLACCKPKIRLSAEPGDLVCGLTPKGRGNRLVYAMQVAEKLPFAGYWADRRFRAKRPDLARGAVIHKCGDNAYEPLPGGGFRQLPSTHSDGEKENPGKKRRDLGGRFVLAADRFAYFGREAIALPPEFDVLIAKRGHKCRFPEKTVRAFHRFFLKLPPGVHAPPARWPAADTSWRT